MTGALIQQHKRGDIMKINLFEDCNCPKLSCCTLNCQCGGQALHYKNCKYHPNYEKDKPGTMPKIYDDMCFECKIKYTGIKAGTGEYPDMVCTHPDEPKTFYDAAMKTRNKPK